MRECTFSGQHQALEVGQRVLGEDSRTSLWHAAEVVDVEQNGDVLIVFVKDGFRAKVEGLNKALPLLVRGEDFQYQGETMGTHFLPRGLPVPPMARRTMRMLIFKPFMENLGWGPKPMMVILKTYSEEVETTAAVTPMPNRTK